MIDVFCRIYATNLIRLGMAITTVERLMLDAEKGSIRLKLLVAEGSLADPSWAGVGLSRFRGSILMLNGMPRPMPSRMCMWCLIVTS